MSRFYWSSIAFLLSAGISFLTFSGIARTAIMVSLLLAYLVVFSLGVFVLRLNFFCRTICRGKTGGMLVSLTFDDGPDPVTTPAVLDVLAKYGLNAAFFCVGEKAARYPPIARRIEDEGHVIANHTYHHFWWTNFLGSKGLTREMAETQETIQGATGKIPAFFRPPMGLTNPHMAKALHHNGLTCVGWDVRTFDTGRTNKQVLDTIARKTRGGSIILLHDTSRSPGDMTELLQDVIAVLKNRGFTFSALDDLLRIEPYQENKDAKLKRVPARIVVRLTGWLAQTGFIRKALADDVTLDFLKQRPTPKFIIGISLVGISYGIGWPAVAFFTFLAIYLNMKLIALLGLVSYIFSHLVFFAGAALAGVEGIRYGRIFMHWVMHKFALWLTKKASPDMGEGAND